MLYRLRSRLFCNQCFSYCDLYFWLLRQSMVQLWVQISNWCLDHTILKTKNCRCSVNAHFQDGVTKLSCTVLAEKAATTLFMSYCPKATLGLPMQQDQKSLRCRWRSVSGCGREGAHIVFAPKGGKCLIYGCLQLIATLITHDAKPKIIDALWRLIFGRGQYPCHFLFCL